MIEMKMGQQDDVDVLRAESCLAERGARHLEMTKRAPGHRTPALKAGIDQHQPTPLHGRTRGEQRVVHWHLGEPLIATDGATAEEIRGNVSPRKTEAPDRMIPTHHSLPHQDKTNIMIGATAFPLTSSDSRARVSQQPLRSYAGMSRRLN